MQDAFTGRTTLIQGRSFPSAVKRAALQDDHRGRLEALARLCAAGDQCGIRPDPDRDLVLLEEDEVSLLEGVGGCWEELGVAIRRLRACLPIRTLSDFGFPGSAENPLEETNPLLTRIGGGVEAWVFLSGDGSVYKFYLPREGKRIGSRFVFRTGADGECLAEAELGDYRALLEKLLIVDRLGVPTEVVAVTPEGVLVAKQSFGDPLPQETDMSQSLPSGLIVFPSRFLRANRDHPRLFFIDEAPFIVADLHARNFVRGEDGRLHPIDLVAAPFVGASILRDSTVADWLARVRVDPRASLLPTVGDDEL